MTYSTSREENSYSYIRDVYENCKDIYKKIVELTKNTQRNPFLGDYSESGSTSGYMKKVPVFNSERVQDYLATL